MAHSEQYLRALEEVASYNDVVLASNSAQPTLTSSSAPNTTMASTAAALTRYNTLLYEAGAGARAGLGVEEGVGVEVDYWGNANHRSPSHAQTTKTVNWNMSPGVRHPDTGERLSHNTERCECGGVAGVLSTAEGVNKRRAHMSSKKHQLWLGQQPKR